MKTIALLTAAFLMLTACTERIVNRPSPVNMAVGVPCKIAPVPTPEWANNGITPSNTLFEQVRAELATEQKRIAYEAALQAAVKSCQ